MVICYKTKRAYMLVKFDLSWTVSRFLQAATMMNLYVGEDMQKSSRAFISFHNIDGR